MAGRGMGWRGSEATKSLASELSTWGRLSLLRAGGSWEGGGSLLVPVATPRELLVAHRAPGSSTFPDGWEQNLQGAGLR